MDTSLLFDVVTSRTSRTSLSYYINGNSFLNAIAIIMNIFQ